MKQNLKIVLGNCKEYPFTEDDFFNDVSIKSIYYARAPEHRVTRKWFPPVLTDKLYLLQSGKKEP